MSASVTGNSFKAAARGEKCSVRASGLRLVSALRFAEFGVSSALRTNGVIQGWPGVRGGFFSRFTRIYRKKETATLSRSKANLAICL